jgi:hypothetical protein
MPAGRGRDSADSCGCPAAAAPVGLLARSGSPLPTIPVIPTA